jgi:esterase/lipase superfamily enzyme/Tfp pilus assembly protein PilF
MVDHGGMLIMASWWLRGAALIVLAALLVGAGSTSATAQDTNDIDALNRQVVQLYQAGNYAEAERNAERAVRLAEGKFGPDHPNVGVALNNLGQLYRAEGRYSEAEPFFKRALAITEKALGPDHPNVGAALTNLGQLYRAEGRYDEAQLLFKRALAIDEKALGPDHPNVGATLNDLATLYHDQGRYAEAEPLYKRALAITEKALGPDHPTVGATLNNLATLYQGQGRYAEAEPLFKRALAIDEKALGPDHLDVSTNLNNLGQLYRAEGRNAEAEVLYQRALAIREKALGPDHPNIGAALNNLATLYLDQGRYAEAEPLYQRALAIDEKALGPDHPDVSTNLNNLGKLYRVEGRYSEAETLIKRALAIDEKALGPDRTSVGTDLDNLAELYRAQGRYAEAEPLYKRALAIDEKALGPDHPDVGKVLNNLAELYRAQGRKPNPCDNQCTPVTIFYGTDRRRSDLPQRIAYDWNRAERLELGRAIVTVPRVPRAPGEINHPSWWEVTLRGVPPEGDPAKHFVIFRGGFKIFNSEDEFLVDVKKYMDEASPLKREAFIFLHGYNTSFDDALFRTAQLAYDLGQQKTDGTVVPFGTAFMYSWPSGGGLADYAYDTDSARLSVDYLRSFIKLVVEKSGAEHIHVIAHSMGNFALVHALEQIASDTTGKPTIDQIILAAPDIDATEFREIAEKIERVAKGYTLYASKNDLAMIASRKVHKDSPRAGDVPERGPIIVAGVDTLDISNVSTTYFFATHHDDYVEEKELLNDVAQLLRTGVHPPSERNINYHPKNIAGNVYWRYGQ